VPTNLTCNFWTLVTAVSWLGALMVVPKCPGAQMWILDYLYPPVHRLSNVVVVCSCWSVQPNDTSAIQCTSAGSSGTVCSSPASTSHYQSWWVWFHSNCNSLICRHAGLGVVLKFWNLSWNVLKLELGPEICTYVLKFSRVFTIFLKTHIILLMSK